MRKNIYEVATVERAKNGKKYPKNTTLIALSATKGQVERTREEGEVSSRYAAIVAKPGIDAMYLFYAIESEFEEFCEKYITGINMKIEALNDLHITVYPEDKQKEIVDIMQSIEQEGMVEEQIVKQYMKIKQNMIDKLFPQGT